MGNKQKKFRLPDDDFQLIELMKEQFKKKGLNISDSDVISLALKALKEQKKFEVDLDKPETPGRRRA